MQKQHSHWSKYSHLHVVPDLDSLVSRMCRTLFLRDVAVTYLQRPCSKLFSFEYLYDFCSQCAELMHGELDSVILGQLSAFTNTSEQTIHFLEHRHSPASRQRNYAYYYHKRILFLHNISAKRLKNLKASFLNNGLVPRRHDSTRRLLAKALTYADTEKVVQFLTTYAEAKTILFPARIPGYRCSDIQLLLSSTTKRQVWLQLCSTL